MGKRFAAQFKSDTTLAHNLNSAQELITSATTLGALIGGLVAGVLSDWTGRRLVLGIADVIFIGGAIGQAVCHDVWSMVSDDFIYGSHDLELQDREGQP